MDWIAGLKKARKAVKKFLTSQQQLDINLCEAVKAGDAEKVKEALAEGGNPSAGRGWKTDNPLCAAIELKNAGIIGILLAAGADPNAKLGYYEDSPFLAAVRAGDAAIVSTLIDAKGNVNAKGDRGNSALVVAASAKNRAVIDLLLDKGAAPDAPGQRSWTPLFWAVYNDDKATIEKLLAKGVRTDRYDEEGRSVLDLARAYDRGAAYHILQAHIDAQVPEWQKTAEQEIAHVSIRRALGYKLTEIFNFGTKERTLITHNYGTAKDTVVRGAFDETADKIAIDQAREKLAGNEPAPKPAVQP